jgi:Fe-S cluster assembly iron-binding protein IscA
MISLTKEAADQIRQAAEQSGAGNMALRIAARVNDAGMLEFGMGFDDERGNDAAVDSWGVTLLINEQSAPCWMTSPSTSARWRPANPASCS